MLQLMSTVKESEASLIYCVPSANVVDNANFRLWVPRADCYCSIVYVSTIDKIIGTVKSWPVTYKLRNLISLISLVTS